MILCVHFPTKRDFLSPRSSVGAKQFSIHPSTRLLLLSNEDSHLRSSKHLHKHNHNREIAFLVAIDVLCSRSLYIHIYLTLTRGFTHSTTLVRKVVAAPSSPHPPLHRQHASITYHPRRSACPQAEPQIHRTILLNLAIPSGHCIGAKSSRRHQKLGHRRNRYFACNV